MIFGNAFYDILNNLLNLDSDVAYWITVVAFVILFLILKSKLENLIIVIITSMMGAYMLVRAFSITQPKFPDEGYIAALYHHKETPTINRIIEMDLKWYILAFIVLFIIGIVVQGSDGDSKEEDSKEDEENKKASNDEEKGKGENEQ